MILQIPTKIDRLLITGAMSGTSLDGIDFCTISINNKSEPLDFTILYESSHGYDEFLKKRLMKLAQNQPTTVREIFEIESDLTTAYHEAFNDHLQFIPAPDCLAAHGQTIYHSPTQNQHHGTWQLLNGHVLAQKNRLVVITQFRQADMALGGQGAPLVPKIDELLFKKYTPIALLNIGGISNLTILSNDSSVLAFDCGPGNMIIDDLMRTFFERDFDDNGKIATSGKIHYDVIEKTLEFPYFKMKPPKSTGRELFNEQWISNWLKLFPQKTKPEDFIATATFLTAKVIAESIKNFSKELPTQLVISGGGSKNKFLIKELSTLLGSAFQLKTSDDFGIHSQYKEALAFALLGYLTLTAQTGNLSSVTGATTETILGAIHLPVVQIYPK